MRYVLHRFQFPLRDIDPCHASSLRDRPTEGYGTRTFKPLGVIDSSIQYLNVHYQPGEGSIRWEHQSSRCGSNNKCVIDTVLLAYDHIVRCSQEEKEKSVHSKGDPGEILAKALALYPRNLVF